MTSPIVDFGPQTRLMARLAEHVTEEQLGAATPCADYEVHNLLGHVVGLTVAFRDAARKDFGPTTDTDPGSFMPDVEPDWRSALPKLLGELAEAWRDPRAWEGMTRAGSVDLPGAVAGAVAMDELVVHGWDLARATGQDYAPDTPSLEASHSLLAQAAEDPASGGGLFGPVVPVPPDAPLLDRVIGLSGRDSGWTPA